MNIFEQYGIKEVADVTLYSIHKKKDGSGDLYYVPALYLDTLKISSVEKTAENVWAQGGLGNERLICWDYGKQINVTLEDALCTPASLGLCWGGVLSSDWKENEVRHDYGISINDRNPVERLSRMEKVFYPRNDRENSVISNLLPRRKEDPLDKELGLLLKSSVVDGVKANGMGYINNKSYSWNLAIESAVKSVSVVPTSFFDVKGKRYRINNKHTINIIEPQSDDDCKYAVVYNISKNNVKLFGEPDGKIIINKTIENSSKDIIAENSIEAITKIEEANYLKIQVDNNDDYYGFISVDGLNYFEPDIPVNVEQFKDIDMWLRFNSINDMIYYLLTKYEDNIYEITPVDIVSDKVEYDLEEDESLEGKSLAGKLWAYVNPKTMSPYPDDYWFHRGEPYFIKSLTLAQKNKKLKSQRITVTAGQFPGMYMIVGETYIRSRETGEDERMQIKFPLCKIKSNQNITLEAEGEPTVFTLEVEVASPVNKIMMELTSYEVAEKMIENENGFIEVKDGSTEVLSE